MTTLLNLDAIAARYAEQMFSAVGQTCEISRRKPAGRKVEPGEGDILFTKALAMVQESGIYGAALYLLYRSGAESDLSKAKSEALLSCYCLNALLSLLSDPCLARFQIAYSSTLQLGKINGSKEPIRRHMAAVAEKEMEQVFLVKQLWEQSLTYARYMARADKKPRSAG